MSPKGGRMPPTEDEYVLLDAAVFIGALLSGDPRHAEARPLVEAARRGNISACTTVLLQESPPGYNQLA